MEVEVLNFIAPHVFYITTDTPERRLNGLQVISSKIKECKLTSIDNHEFLQDEICAIPYGDGFARAVVVGRVSSASGNDYVNYCWLTDYGIIEKSDKLYKLPEHIRTFPSLCQAASLNNICYIREQLELGVTGIVKKIQSLIPTLGSLKSARVILSNYEKVIFEVDETVNNTLIGDLIVHKDGREFRLTQELCDRDIVTINAALFQNIKGTGIAYIKTHFHTIYQTGKLVKRKTSTSGSESASSNSKFIESVNSDFEDLDVSHLSPLENGRRRNRLSNHQDITSESDTSINEKPFDDMCNEAKMEFTSTPNQNLSGWEKLKEYKKKKAALQQSEAKMESTTTSIGNISGWEKLKEYKKKKAASQQAEANMEFSNTPNRNLSEWEKLKEYKRKKASLQQAGDSFQSDANSSAEKEAVFEKSKDDSLQSDDQSLRENEVFEKNSKVLDTSESKSESATSEKKRNLNGLVFVPAGMERSLPKRASKVKKHSSGHQHSTLLAQKDNEGSYVSPKRTVAVESGADEDCPTIKVPKISDTDNGNLSAAESNPNGNAETETSSSEPQKVPIYTRQDFLKDFAGCSCNKCRTAVEEDDWDAPLKFTAEETAHEVCEVKGIVIKPTMLLKADNQDSTESHCEILSVDYKSMPTMEKKMSAKVLVHGESIPHPTSQVSKVNIHPDIYETIRRIDYKESKRIQLYAFPSITRNQHVFMINEKKTGKTMAYLPILISFVMEKQERYSQLLKLGGGPLVVILCSSSVKCEEVYLLAKMILGRLNRKCCLVTYPGHGNISNVDILITMPTVLSTMITNRATNFKRLCHLVLEDADVILKHHNELVLKFLNYGNQVLAHRNCPKSIQLIMCAQHWSTDIEHIALKLSKTPLICIADHLEAALYGKMRFIVKFLDTGCKAQNIQKILKDCYNFTKSVIVCDENELDELQTLLTLKGIEFTSFAGITEEEDILYLETVWSNAPGGKYLVLVCTDDTYNLLTITSATLVIHYSLPHNWSQFKRRFSCLLENVPSPFEALDKRKTQISCYVFIDENCKQNMARFNNFVKMSGLEQGLPEKVKTFFEGLSMEIEQGRVKERVEFCPTLRVIGKCDAVNCEKRHVLSKKLEKTSDILPQNGLIKFKILTMTDAASCSIKLLEHFDLFGHSVRKFEDQNEEIRDKLAATRHCDVADKIKPLHLYLIKEQDQYFRCRVVERKEQILVYLIDRGIYRKVGKKELYKMPENVKSIPAQCYEAYFANLIPPFEDRTFSKTAYSKAQFLFDSNCSNSVMMATVVLQLGDNVWIEDVYECRAMHDKSLPGMGFQLTRKLIEQGIAVGDDAPLQKLYGLCKEAEIELPEYKVAKPSVKRTSEDQVQVQPTWAFLDQDMIHEVIFTFATSPDEFYIRQNKFSKQLNQLEEEIQKAIRKPFYPAFQKADSFKCCLVRDAVNGQYVRGMILSVFEEKAEILCVDYGDVVDEDVSALKHISNELILKLPFQSIQCSMYGVKPVDKEWGDAATDLLYAMAFQEGNTQLKPLFAKINSKQDNSIVKRQNSYVVSLKDGIGRQALINELLIDCGYAITSVEEEMQDFDLPNALKMDNGDDDIEEIQPVNYDVAINGEVYADEDMFADFDCEIIGLTQFMEDMGLPLREINSSQNAITNGPGTSDLPAIKAAPAVDFLTPEVYWSQTDEAIKLDIKVSDVVEPKIAIKHCRNFQFNTHKDNKKYRLSFFLYGKVESSVQHTILGSQVRVTLRKSKPEEWPRLLFSQEKVRKVHYDTTTLKLDDDTVQKRPLLLNISDSSSDDESHVVLEYSDVESEYDQDLPVDAN